MSPKKGRPKSDDAMRVNIKYRIDDETNKKLESYCEQHNTTKTDVARTALKQYLGIKK